jgi:hypothetical protein
MEKLETPYVISPHRKSRHPPHIGRPVVPPKNATNRAPPCLHLFAPAGTLQHEVLEGEQAAAFAEDETMLVKVNCRSDAGVLEGNARYGLLVTIEVAEQLEIPIYDEIAARIRPAVQVRSAA